MGVYLIISAFVALVIGLTLTVMEGFNELPMEGKSQMIGAGAIIAFIWPTALIVVLGMLLGKLRP